MSDEEEKKQSSRIQKFWDWANQTDLVWVMLGGLLGGLMMPLVRSFLEKQANFNAGIEAPLNWYTWAFGSLFGLICAGIVVYTLGYSDNRNKRQTFFVAMLAGLTFPAVLSNVTGYELSEKTEVALETASNVTDDIVEADENASEEVKEVVAEEKIKAAEQGVELLQTALVDSPADQLDRKTQRDVEAQAVDIAVKIAESSENEQGEAKKKIVNELKKAVATAEKQGYRDVARNRAVKEAIAQAN